MGKKHYYMFHLPILLKKYFLHLFQESWLRKVAKHIIYPSLKRKTEAIHIE